MLLLLFTCCQLHVIVVCILGYCTDMTLRGYNGINFEERSRLNLNATVLSMIYVEEFDELLTAGQGYISSWNMKLIEYGFLVEPKEPSLLTDINCKLFN